MRKIFSIMLAFLFTGLALTYSLWGVDFARLGELLSAGNYLMLAPFWAFVFLFYWMNALRWVVILRPLGRYRWNQVMPAMMVGFGANNILPAHLGELLRALVFSRRFGQPFSAVLVSLVLERILDVVAILAFYLIALSVLGDMPESLRTGATAVAWVVGAGLAGIALLLLRADWILAIWGKMGKMLPGALRDKGEQALEHAIAALSSLKSPSMTLVLLLWSLARWSASAGSIWVSLYAYGLVMPYQVSLVVLAVTALAVTVPSAPGYVGAIQAAFVFALLPFGVDRETAFAASVFFLVSQWVPVTFSGLWFMMISGIRFADAEQAKQAELAEEAG